MRGEVSTIRPIVPEPRGDAEWFAQTIGGPRPTLPLGVPAAQSGAIGAGEETWMETTVEGPGNVSFHYKMSSVSGDALYFYVDTTPYYWTQGSTWPWTGNIAVPSGTHTLKWKYTKYAGSTEGSCWVDAIQWTGGAPESEAPDWEQITYTYDPSGRRIAKLVSPPGGGDVDGEVTKYVYDGDQCIAEYDGGDTLLRKYIHGPSIDEPICMIEVADANAAYFYHYDALGSVVALSDADGDTVQVYEYDVYGQVAASDANHPNPFMFTGRRFDPETGLYYYRARYYNASIGRFLQTDPIGYADGMNWYAYCRNNPGNSTDSTGTESEPAYSFSQANGCLVFTANGISHYFKDGIDDWILWAEGGGLWWDGDAQEMRRVFPEGWEKGEAGWLLAGAGGEEDRRWWFWRIKALTWLSGQLASTVRDLEKAIVDDGLELELLKSHRNWYEGGIVEWNPGQTQLYEGDTQWYRVHPLAMLAHELAHAQDDADGGFQGRRGREGVAAELNAMKYENFIRKALWMYDPTQANLFPRPGYLADVDDLDSDVGRAWKKYRWRDLKYGKGRRE